MTDSLVFDLVEWVEKQDRSYSEVMETWRTSCPRLTIWEDAVDRGLVERKTTPDGRVVVAVTAEGRKFLADRRPPRSLRAEAKPYPARLS
jgi:ribosomal protein L34